MPGPVLAATGMVVRKYLERRTELRAARARPRWRRWLLLPAAGLLLAVAVFAGLLGSFDSAEAVTPGCPGGPPGPVPGPPTQVDDEQYGNALTIVGVGQDRGVGEYGLVISLAAALQESQLYNLDYGHADSVGLFQQRPAAGWGTVEQIMDPVYAATAFFGGADVPPDNPGLLDIAGWEQMTVTEAAQAVQVSAFPDAYADDEPLARQLVAEITGSGGMCGPPGAMNCPPSGLDVEEGLTPDALRVVRCVVATFGITDLIGVGDRPDNPGSDHPSGRAVDVMITDWATEPGNATGWQVGEWARTNAAGLGVKYVIFDAQIWSVDRADEGWRPYTHPSGCSTPTCAHLDHVHVSVHGDAAGGPVGDWMLPLPAGSYTVTAGFGDCGETWENCHTGLDLAAPIGVPVTAVGAGTVATVQPDAGGPYGNFVTVDHGGNTVTAYAHLDTITAGLAPGQTLPAGSTLGTVGDTGNTTGPHLHLEVRLSGTPVDPDAWLRAHGVDP